MNFVTFYILLSMPHYIECDLFYLHLILEVDGHLQMSLYFLIYDIKSDLMNYIFHRGK